MTALPFVCCVLAALTATPFLSCTRGVDRSEAADRDAEFAAKFSRRAVDVWDQRSQRASDELEELRDHQWAGRYYRGDGLGSNATLTLAPESGCVFIRTGCLGVYDRNVGDVVEQEDGSIRLALQHANRTKGFRGVAEHLVPIRWGNRRYLVAADDLRRFALNVWLRREPRDGMHGSFFLRDGDHKKRVGGKPVAPAAYSRYFARPSEKR